MSEKTSKTATQALRERVLNVVYTPEGYKPLSGHHYLAASHKSKAGIFVIDGTFTREDYALCTAEAKFAGLRTNKLYVYARLVAYNGSDIDWAKFSEIGIDPDAVHQENQLTAA